MYGIREWTAEERAAFLKDYGSAWNEASARIFLETPGVISPYANLVETPAEIFLMKECLNLYTQEKISGKMKLEGYGTMVAEI